MSDLPQPQKPDEPLSPWQSICLVVSLFILAMIFAIAFS